ncbi:integral membrane proteins containing uncharacterized repeats-like protein [Haloferula helveola]|uniref:Integral membrane proteins containing uncharacterized repeats-like protein n=1 Tax=Haloferula helveola TaxID=490095 RepID=A0ABM7RGL9_9BACT|nr:integral membrane proteins containing uncharacterized repeats-like protein [Haloferula helveola]
MKAPVATALVSISLLQLIHAASPVADAGADIEIVDLTGDESVTVALDASGTTDTDGDVVSYTWSWAGGSSSGQLAEGTFPATDVPVTVTLTVTDSSSNTDVDTVEVTVFRKETALFTDFEGRLGNLVTGTVAGETLVISNGFSHDGVHRRVGGAWVYDPIPDFLDPSRAIDPVTFLTGAVELGGQDDPYTLYRFDGTDWIESPVTAPASIIPMVDPVNDIQQLQYAVDAQTFLVSDRYNNQYGAFGGRVFVYDWSGDTLAFNAELLPPGGVSAGDNWGDKIALEDDLIVVTSENSSGFGADLQIYRKVTGSWTHEATVVSDDPSGEGFSAFELSIGNGRILVGTTAADGVTVVEKVGASWVQTDIASITFGIPGFFGYQMNDDGESFIADDEFANIILFEKDAVSSDWSTATVSEKRLLASDLTPRRFLSVTGFDNDLAVVSDQTLGRVRVYDTTTYRHDINVEPVADAGADISTTSFDGEGVRVFLNGGLSSDLNGDVLSAVWTWDGGSVSGLQAFATLDPSVTSVELTVTDGAGGVSRDSISVDIESPPVISSMQDVAVVDTDGDGSIRLQVNGAVDSQDNPIVAWNWIWPGGTFSGQSGLITLEDPANGNFITLEVIDSKGLVSRSQFAFSLMQDNPFPDFIVPIDGVSLDRFGSSVAISDGTVIINAEDKPTGPVYTGATYLSENINDVWQQIRLANGEFTASAVVIDGDSAFLGAKRYNDGTADRVGAVRVFESQSGIWTEVQLLEIPETVTPFYSEYEFGASVATSGDWLAVGTPGDNTVASRAGSVFLFQRVGGTWSFSQKVTPPAPFNVAFTSFGSAVALRGGTLVVGSTKTQGFDNDSAAFVYELAAGSWGHVHTFTSDGFEPNGTIDTVQDSYAAALAVTDTEILVGAPGEPNDGVIELSRGVVYRYTKPGGTWASAGKIVPVIDTAFGSGSFGTSLFFRSGHLLVGDPSFIIQDGAIRGKGEVHVFREQAGGWSLADRISVTNEIDPTYTNSQSPNFGISVAHDGSDLIVGSSNGRNDAGLRTGKAFVFRDYAALNPNANFEPLADAGSDISVTDSVVRGPAPDYEITEPLGSEEVTLDGSGSSDQENSIVSWEWEWSGGSASGETVSARFPVGSTTVTLTVTDAAGIVNTDTVDVIVALPQTAPDPLPSTAGNTLTVNLPRPESLWRLSSEFLWHPSGATIDDIVDGEEYQLEMIGFPGSTQVVTSPITPGAGATVLNPVVALEIPATETGTLTFPETAQGFSWRFTGESVWRNVADNGDTFEDLIATTVPVGNYRIEFKPVAGYTTPGSREITISSTFTLGLNWGDYLRISNFDASKTFDLVASPNLEGDPYQYVGMIRTPLGRGTGTVVADRVVLTAGHLFFDFNGLNWADTQWFPRQQQDTRQAPPMSPRGILYRTSYAKLIAPDSVEGEVANLPEDAQEVDFAALYFSDVATWDGGSANFLESNADRNWMTGSEPKHAVGYPQRSQTYPVRGRIFEKTFSTALSAIDSNPLPKLYQSTEVFGDGGASGSALFVEPPGTGQQYPAAILLAGQGRAVYRVIDSEITRMIKDAEDASTGNDDVLDSNSSLVTFDNLGAFTTLSVTVSPGATLSAARWTVTPNAGSGYANVKSGQQVPFNPDWDSFTFTFNAVSGYATPDPVTFLASQVTAGATNTFNVVYEPLSGYDIWKQLNLISDDSFDGDGDTLVALMEYALDLDPDVADYRPPIRMKESPAQSTFAEFEVYVSAVADAIRYEVEVADSLEDLATGTNVTTLQTFTKADGSSDYITVTDTQPISSSTTRFGRVVITHDRSLSTGP